MAKQETKIQQDIQKWVNKNGGVISKTHGSQYSKRGEVDLWGSLPATKDGAIFIHFAVETKVPGEEETEIQAYRLKKWAEQGYATAVVAALPQFIEFLSEAYMQGIGISRGIGKVWRYYEQ